MFPLFPLAKSSGNTSERRNFQREREIERVFPLFPLFPPPVESFACTRTPAPVRAPMRITRGSLPPEKVGTVGTFSITLVVETL